MGNANFNDHKSNKANPNKGTIRNKKLLQSYKI
jgi:hypothetical protein